MQNDAKHQEEAIRNREAADSGAKLIFGNPTLCAQHQPDY